MASVWTIRCPVHSEIIKAEKLIPFVKDGISSDEPIFYCDRCGSFREYL